MINYVIIKGFKSIKHMKFNFYPKKNFNDLIILIGVNESGKSNILEAIHLKHKTFKDEWKNEECNEHYILYSVSFKENEFTEIKEKMEKISVSGYDTNEFYQILKPNESLKLCDENGNEISLIKNILKQKNYFCKWFEEEKNDLKNEFENYPQLYNELDNRGLLEFDNFNLKKIEEWTEEENDSNRKKLSNIPINNMIKIRKHITEMSKFVDSFKIADELLKLFEIFHNITFIKRSSLDIKDKYNIEEIKNSENGNGNQTIRALLSIAGLDNKKFEDVSKKEYRNLEDKFSLNIQNSLKCFYDQEEVKIDMRLETSETEFFVSDSTRKEKHSLKTRSDGFKEFLSFLILLENHKLIDEKSQNKSYLLLDEPGYSLHPLAQSEFVKILKQFSKKYNIIYSTHSPYLINVDDFLFINVISKDKELGTVILNNPIGIKLNEKNEKFEGSLLPYMVKLGLDINKEYWMPKNNKIVFVEGISDIIFFRTMFKIQEKVREKEILKNYFFISLDGADKINILINFYTNYDMKYIGILDSDKKGKESKKKREKNEVCKYFTYFDIDKDWDNKTADDFIFEDEIKKTNESKPLKFYGYFKNKEEKGFKEVSKKEKDISRKIVEFIEKEFNE